MNKPELKKYFEKYKPKIEEELEKFFDYERKRFFRGGNHSCDDVNEFLFSEARRFTLSKGKRARPGLVLIGYQGVTGREPDEKIVRASTSLELLHAYLLVHDDIFDKDEIRRNEPTVWKAFLDRYGDKHFAISMATLVGDVLQNFCTERLLSSGVDLERVNSVLVKLCDTLNITVRGEAIDVYIAYKPLSEVTEEEILKVYEYKTAEYTVVNPLEVGAILGGRENVYREYGIPVGIAFQIKDDLLGIFGDTEVTGKPNDSDIKEGKRTLPVLYAYRDGSEADRKVLESVLGNENATSEEVQQVRDIILSTGAKDRAEQYARELASVGKARIEERKDIDPYIQEVLLEFADFIVEREK